MKTLLITLDKGDIVATIFEHEKEDVRQRQRYAGRVNTRYL